MLASVALLVCQVRVVDWPFSTVFGLAVSDAVGPAGAGGGGGGGGATFFLQAPSIITAASANTSAIHFVLPCFTFCLLPACTCLVISIAVLIISSSNSVGCSFP